MPPTYALKPWQSMAIRVLVLPPSVPQVILCICMGTIFFDLGHSWKETFSRAAMLFFVAVGVLDPHLPSVAMAVIDAHRDVVAAGKVGLHDEYSFSREEEGARLLLSMR